MTELIWLGRHPKYWQVFAEKVEILKHQWLFPEHNVGKLMRTVRGTGKRWQTCWWVKLTVFALH